MTRPVRTTRTIVFAIALAATACHGGHGALPSAPTGDAWATMSWEERHDVMTFAVLPNMARAFQRFTGADEPSMTCVTCHGSDPERVQYAMPHGLPPLDPSRMPSKHSTDPLEAKMAAFMIDEITPAMADLLEVPRYDPVTRKGFSCFNCHPSVKP